MFFNQSLNVAVRSSRSELQSAPSLVFADCIGFSIFSGKEYNRSDFGIDHLVMSMCIVFPCVVGRGCLLWPEKHILLLYWLCQWLWLCSQQQTVGNSTADRYTRPPDWPLRNLYAGQEVTVRTGQGTTDWFQIGKWVRQGCILSPCFFNIYAEYIMRNAGLDEAQVGIKIARRNINNLRCADNTTLMAESEEELKSLLMTVKRRVKMLV